MKNKDNALSLLGRPSIAYSCRLLTSDGVRYSPQPRIWDHVVIPDRRAHYRPFQIIGIRSEQVRRVTAVDPKQSLEAARRIVSGELYTIEFLFHGSLEWQDETAEACFPRMPELRTGLQAYEKRDYETAMKTLSPFAESGVSECMVLVASIYDRRMSRDVVLARRWYGRAAREGHAQAWHNLGTLYVELGLGAKAKRCFCEASELGLNVTSEDWRDRCLE